MKSNSVWRIRLAQVSLGAVIVVALVWVSGTKAGNEPIHLTTDWSHRHVVFSAPHNLGQHVRLLSNPRYVQQLIRRNSHSSGAGDGWRWRRAPEPTEDPTLMHRDWGVYLGSGGSVGANNYPAKYSFDPASANCATDFVVYNTGLSPSAAGTDATTTAASGIFKGNGSSITNGNTVTVSNNNLISGNVLTLFANTGALATASGTISDPTTSPGTGRTVTVGTVIYAYENAVTAGTAQILIGANNTASIQNLRAAIDENLSECATAGCFSATGITAPNPAVTHPAAFASPTITLTASSDGAAGNFTIATSSGFITVAGGTQGAGANDGINFLVSATTTTSATNLAAAIQRSGAGIGVGASVTSGNTSGVTITSLNSGAGATNGAVDISTATTMSNAANGFTAFSTPLSGGAAGASIVAYHDIYSGCAPATVPSMYWAYNTGGTVATSPVLSGGGDQLAFVQNVGTTGTLVLLKWKAATTDTVDAPEAPTAVTAANYPTCSAPCMTSFSFPAGGTITDTNSSPFYDFANDVIYVGDDGGHLRRFNNAFRSTTLNPPAQAASGGFPVTLTHGGKLTSPVFDDGSGLVFVASSSGYLTSVLPATGVQTNSNQLATGNGFYDGPLLDPSNDHVYVITSDTLAGTANDSGIYSFTTTTSINASNGTLTIVSANNPNTPIYVGTFDNIWYTSTAGTGNMYVCGSAAASNIPTLYKIVDTAGVLSTVSTGPSLTTAAGPACSPVTEFFNPSNTNGGANSSGTDLIFLSVTASGQTAAPVTCSTNAACLMTFDVTSGAALTAAKATTATLPVVGGTSGIVVDGSVPAGTLAGASQVYFAPLTPTGTVYANCATSGAGVIGGCATQASQAGLN